MFEALSERMEVLALFSGKKNRKRKKKIGQSDDKFCFFSSPQRATGQIHSIHRLSKRKEGPAWEGAGAWEGGQGSMQSVEGAGEETAKTCEERSGGKGSGEAEALIWTAGTGKSKGLEDRAGEGGRSCPTLELGRCGEAWDRVWHPRFKQGWGPNCAPGFETLWVGTREATQALLWWERQAQRQTRAIPCAKCLEAHSSRG